MYLDIFLQNLYIKLWKETTLSLVCIWVCHLGYPYSESLYKIIKEGYLITSMYLDNCVIYYINIGKSLHFIPISKYVLGYSMKPSSEFLYKIMEEGFIFLD